MDTIFQPHFVLQFQITSSKMGIVRLQRITRKTYSATPITDARVSGLYLSGPKLYLGLPTVEGQSIHRRLDAHFEGKADITWVRLTLCDDSSGTTIWTDVPMLNRAEYEHEEFCRNAAARRMVISRWLDDLAGDL